MPLTYFYTNFNANFALTFVYKYDNGKNDLVKFVNPEDIAVNMTFTLRLREQTHGDHDYRALWTKWSNLFCTNPAKNFLWKKSIFAYKYV